MPPSTANGSRTSAPAPRCRDLPISFANSPLDIVRLVQEDRFQLPFTQGDFAEASGLSIVHVNRTIQELRRKDLIEWRGSEVGLLRRRELESIPDFRPDYLHALRTSSPDAALLATTDKLGT